MNPHKTQRPAASRLPVVPRLGYTSFIDIETAGEEEEMGHGPIAI
jgi:hypothetical protein